MSPCPRCAAATRTPRRIMARHVRTPVTPAPTNRSARDAVTGAERRPTLSVVIVSYECRGHLLDLLADLEVVRAAIPIDVHVVDNASTDQTPDAVRREFPWVDLDASAENLGFGRANNRAIARATGDVILLLNPDTRIDAPTIIACVDQLRRHPTVGILSPRVVDEAGRLDPNCRRGFPTIWGVFCHVTGLDRVLTDRRSRRYSVGWVGEFDVADVEAVSGAVMFCRANPLHALGGFDERFFMYGEDLDLCLRMGEHGWRVQYWPKATVVHLGGRSGMTVRSRIAWARSIGDLHRYHRPGWDGRLGGLAADAAGGALAMMRIVTDVAARVRARR